MGQPGPDLPNNSIQLKACNVTGCSNRAIAKGWCDKHRKRIERHGNVLYKRPRDWGERTNHPLYKLWRGLARDYGSKSMLDESWKSDFWEFVSDVGEKPSKEHHFRRFDESKPFSAENYQWKYIKTIPGDRKEKNRVRQKQRRAKNPEYNFAIAIKNRYGISASQYYDMLEKQGHVCAICSRPEKSIDHRTGKVRRLAVDHCHETGKVRGLLCKECNNALGIFDDDINRLKAAIRYLNGE